jgi:hypothetical protein
VHIETDDPGCGRPLHVRVTGNATFLRLPKLLEQLEALPPHRRVELNLAGLRHVDHASGIALSTWEREHNARAGDDGAPAGGAPARPGTERPAGAGRAAR